MNFWGTNASPPTRILPFEMRTLRMLEQGSSEASNISEMSSINWRSSNESKAVELAVRGGLFEVPGVRGELEQYTILGRM